MHIARLQVGVGGFTAWRAVLVGWKGELVVLNGNLDKHKYIRILDNTRLPFVQAAFQNNLAYQYANDPAHITCAMFRFMENHDVQHLQWPPLP